MKKERQAPSSVVDFDVETRLVRLRIRLKVYELIGDGKPMHGQAAKRALQKFAEQALQVAGTSEEDYQDLYTAVKYYDTDSDLSRRLYEKLFRLMESGAFVPETVFFGYEALYRSRHGTPEQKEFTGRKILDLHGAKH